MDLIEKYTSIIKQTHTVHLTENEKEEIQRNILDFFLGDSQNPVERFATKRENEIFFKTLQNIYDIDLTGILLYEELQ